jgi:hypothetical protein
MNNGKARPLKLRSGDIVEVRSEVEILATLDEQGGIDGMPFMPEMLEYCGKKFRVENRADKSCDTITQTGCRRLYDTVHLEDLRCDGCAHGGCQAQCLLFWKEQWLKRVVDICAGTRDPKPVEQTSPGTHPVSCSRSRLFECTQSREATGDEGIRYRCQATDLLLASQSMAWWDIRQYVRDLHSRNIGVLDLMRTLLFWTFHATLKFGAYRAQLFLYNQFQSWRGGTPYPFGAGTLDKTPRETLDLQPGELVEVKSQKAILHTLNKRNRNLGLLFGAEMVPYCGSVRRVRARVERIIDERSGKMLTFSSDCLILDGVVCQAKYSDRRAFCPRRIYPFWREIWLQRVEEAPDLQAKPKPSKNRCSPTPPVALPEESRHSSDH